MSYSCAGAPRVGRYSNPNITYLGVAQGIDPNVNPARGAFNARRLNETATNVAGFRGSVVVQLPPASPSALSVSADGAAAVNISWSDNSDNESSFSVERSLDNINFSEIGIVSANTTSYNDNGLLSETTYYYRVKASNNAGASSYSNTGTVTTEAQPSTVESVASSQTLGIGTVSGGFANTHTDNGAIQRITEVSSGGPKRNRTQSYRHTYRFDNIGGAGGAMLSANAYISGSEGAVFEYSANGGSSWTLMFTVSSQSSANTESFAFPGGTSGTVLVRVRDAAQTRGESADSVSIDSLVITSSTVVGAPPSSPSGLTVTSVTGSSVALRYSDNSDNEFGFEIWRGLTSGVCKTGTMVGTASANQTSYTDNTASASTTYFYDVSAFNGGGSSANRAGEVSATTDAAPAISASARGYKVKGRQTVDVTWTGTSGSSVQVYRNSSPITTANDGAYTDSIGIKGGGSYSYKVCETGSTTACSSTVSVIF